MSSEIAISASQLGKSYHIYRRPVDRLKQMLWRGRRIFFEEYWALRNVSLDVRRGETVGLIGRNGSGKSTFLQLVCGTLNPSTGTIQTNGRIAALLELGAGFNPEFTGRENIYLAASVLGLSSAEIDARYQDILDFAAIGDFIDQPVRTYSSGMYARLAFAVAAHVDADILIIDEILAVGDAVFTQKCMRYIRRFKEHGTIFFVSHDIGAVLNLCDRVLWLDCGEVRGCGDPKDICQEYLAAAASEQEHPEGFRIGGSRSSSKPAAEVKLDPRHDEIAQSNLKNVIDVFSFNPDAPWFGYRGMTITSVTLSRPDGVLVPFLEGGEEAVLTVQVTAERDIEQPIVGFYIMDRLGQPIFGDNTYLTYREQHISLPAGTQFTASFRFQMPYLPAGEFTVTAAAAEGTQAEHVQHHWINDALVFRIASSHVAGGLVGIPMLDISLDIIPGRAGEQPETAGPAFASATKVA